jgi:UDPglucose 6-dehydrogenase
MNTENKIGIFGLWHLGTVFSGCLSNHYKIIGYDSSEELVRDLNSSISPVYEPGLNKLLEKNITQNRLKYTTDLGHAVNSCEFIWITYDTPVSNNDIPDEKYVYEKIENILSYRHDPAIVIISSQLKVGSIAIFSKKYPQHKFVCIPENLRLGRGIETFEFCDRLVIGINSIDLKEKFINLFSFWNIPLLFMSCESAEMVKHAINSYLALSITFINEIKDICVKNGANPQEVSMGLKSDSRIGQKAYLNPGAPFSGGTLARDVRYLNEFGDNTDKVFIPIINSILPSNDFRKNWNLMTLNSVIKPSDKILFLGITYKRNTDSLRRTEVTQLFSYLKNQIDIFDPLVHSIENKPDNVIFINKCDLNKYDVISIFTDYPEYSELNWGELNSEKFVLDQNNYLSFLKNYRNIKYINI